MPPSSKQEKTMSSRLLAMKFMQRAANATASGPGTPQESSDQSAPSRRNDITDDSVPPTKRQRVDKTAASSSSDLQAISAAVKAEEDKRAAAVAKQAAEAGETEWILEFPAGTVPEVRKQPNIVSLASYDSNEIGQEGEGDGRRSYGGYKRKARTVNQESQQPAVDDEEAEPASRSRKPEDEEYDEINSEFQERKNRGDRGDPRRDKSSKQHKKSGGKDKDLSRLTSLSGNKVSKPDPGALGRKKNKKGK